jgi:MarR family 2-MHQ and catechol resistance regulon transcriptional repressor
METGAHIRLVFGKAYKATEAADRKGIAGTGLNISDFSIMEALLNKGPLPVNTIGKKVLLTSGSMTAAVNRLEKKGLVVRIQDPSDGRCFHVHLTKTGHMKIEKAYEKHEQNLEQLAEALTSEERDSFVKLLKKMGRHAQGLNTV